MSRVGGGLGWGGDSHGTAAPIRGQRGQRSLHGERAAADSRGGWVMVTGSGRSRCADGGVVLSPQPHIVAAAQAVASHRSGRGCRSPFASGAERNEKMTIMNLKVN